MIAFYQGKISFFRTIQDAQIWIASELKKEKEARVLS
jgi:hypothetical protein